MTFILQSQPIGGLSFSIWETSSGQFVAIVEDPDCRWQSEPVTTVAEAESLARLAMMNELVTLSQIVNEITAAVLSA